MNRKSPHCNLQGLWPTILCGEGVKEHFLTGKQTACPICGGKDRFRFDDKGEGRWYCNHCGAGDGFTLLDKFQGHKFVDALEITKKYSGVTPMNVRRSQDDQAKFARLREVWERRASIWDVDCLAYLKTRRIEQGDLLDNDSIDLAWHHGLPCDGNVAPCLLARYRHNSESFASSKLVTIQRIWPSLGEKRVMPSPIKMNGVFCPLGGWPEDTLGVAEGIITALSARVVMGSMGRHIPVWACYSAEQMMRFVPPPSIKSLFVFMDVDKSFAGQAAAYELARKLAVSHPQITVSLRRSFPGEHVDRDFNDFLVLMRNKEERSHG